jgi:soluble lytic murein transglycosylase-like protein
LAGVLVLTPAIATAEPWADAIAEASTRFGLPEPWVREMIRAESGGDVRALSPKGAMGLMQLMPRTWRTLRAELGLGPDPFQPHDNILAGVAYLRSLYDRYGFPAFLAAYNAGPARADDYLLRSRPLPAETRRYVARLAPAIGGAAVAAAVPQTVFAVRHDSLSTSGTTSTPVPDGLFAVRSGPPTPGSEIP